MQFNRHFINRIEKKDVLRLLLALVAVFVIGVLGEFVCNFPALRANGWTRQATRTIALDEVQVSGFERVETEKQRCCSFRMQAVISIFRWTAAMSASFFTIMITMVC